MMTSLIVFSTFIFILLLVSLYYNYKFAMTIFRFEDNIDQCLDILDDRYNSITKILEIPVFFDSVEIRAVINEIDIARESIVSMSNILTDYNYKNNSEKIEDNEEEN